MMWVQGTPTVDKINEHAKKYPATEGCEGGRWLLVYLQRSPHAAPSDLLTLRVFEDQVQAYTVEGWEPINQHCAPARCTPCNDEGVPIFIDVLIEALNQINGQVHTVAAWCLATLERSLEEFNK